MAWPLANHFESTGHSFSSHLAFTSRHEPFVPFLRAVKVSAYPLTCPFT
ncbi:hypothetical protein COLO4_12036 [Corchorus olitorius]|uniref:Uncharacterized protein n=1 Tax=Corchorus olitorius TaxID=93759 RepID=A0A1R3K2E3_9ROSI|nr:hypothetical protein COLO4_12036 [Corchorus olitorius]